MSVSMESSSIEGDTAEARIKARRERISARMAAGDTDIGNAPRIDRNASDLDDSVDPNPHASNSKMLECKEIIEALREEASHEVSLIRITADFARTQQLNEDDNVRTAARQRLVEEREISEKQFVEIEKKWHEALKRKNATDLNEELEALKAETDGLVKRKNGLIDNFKEDLKKKDTNFMDELRSQGSDIETLLKTMTDQAKTMWGSYKKQLDDIEQAMLAERDQLLNDVKSTYTKRVDHRRESELTQAQAKLGSLEEHESRMEHARETGHEDYMTIKAKLEDDIALLEQQLEKTRAIYQLNTEKLDYNFEVLKKRKKENMDSKTQLSKKLTRMRAQLHTLREKGAKQSKTSQDENASLLRDYKRISDQYRELQKKFNHFQTLDHNQYRDVWNLNEDAAVGLLKQVLSADEVLASQQLGVKWIPPSQTELQSRARKAEIRGRTAAETIEEMFEDDDDESVHDMMGDIPGHVIKSALLMLGKEAEYLLESKLAGLLEPLDEKRRNLMKLDAIFKAINVTTEDELYRLAKCFIQEDSDGFALVHPNRVNDLLQGFVEAHRSDKGLDQVGNVPDYTPLPYDNDFWKRLPTVHSESHVRVWSAMEEALQKYSTVLQDREDSLDKTEQLQLQNEELKMLLKQYMAADVNRDLVIPPSMVLL
eukprot:m.25648 g.25648  ORF g.25648 m.25648 type:complete len:656 (-) comp15112_c0_seq1:195-2162(-)